MGSNTRVSKADYYEVLGVSREATDQELKSAYRKQALKSTGSAQQLRSGVTLIMKQMEEILEKMQVRAIPAVGESFDPRVHEALGAVERDDVPDQHVAEEIRRGYKIRERLLRPALVRVAHNSKQVNE